MRLAAPDVSAAHDDRERYPVGMDLRDLARHRRGRINVNIAAVPGEGRSPLTLAMFTIDPPSACFCITTFTRWENTSGAIKFGFICSVTSLVPLTFSG